MATPLDIKGCRFGKLTVISLIPEDERRNKYNRREWLCKCDCGNSIIVEQRHLTGTKYIQHSCGCIRVKAHLVATSKMPFLTLEYVDSFQDFEKFAYLHKQIVKLFRVNELTELYYKEYIDKFYNEEQFNNIYMTWKESNNEKDTTFYDWYKPSLDHIVPKSRGGDNSLDNLQYLTVFENLSKRDMTMIEWEEFKQKTNTKSELFL